MNDVEKRMSLLLEHGVICQKTYEKSFVILSELSLKYSLDERSNALVMHLIMCLQRAYSNMQLLDEVQQMHTELASSDYYDDGMAELNHLQKIANVTLNESEKVYILMHFITMCQQRKEEKTDGSN